MPGISLFLLFSWFVIILYGYGLHHLLTAQGDSPCEMTYMFEYPQYVKIGMADDVTRAYNRYGLYAYGEGQHTNTLRKMRFSGIPVLYIPGNAGSYKQARSLASVSLRKALNAHLSYHMDFFTVDLNEEYSALYGGVLEAQTQFVKHAIQRILELYQNNKGIQPTSVVLIGHSMGGLIAKGLFTDPVFNRDQVKVIITLATPHYEPVIAFDSYISSYYHNISNEWRKLQKNDYLKDITLASIGGGDKDKLVRSGLIHSWEIDMHTVTTTIPTVWRSVDHLCIVWCKELVLVLVRALFDMVDLTTKQITNDSALRRAVLTYHLLKRDSGKQYLPSIHPQFVTFHDGIEWIEPLSRQLTISANLDPHGRDRLKKPTHIMIRLVDNPRHALLTVEAINQDAKDWVFVCHANVIVQDYRTCATGENLSNATMLWPSVRHKRKRIVLDLLRLQKKMYSHVILRIPMTSEPIQLNIDVHSPRMIQAPPMNVMTLFDPRPVTIVSKTEEKAVHYEIEFRSVQSVWHAAHLVVKPLSCSRSEHHAVAMLVVPWSNEKSFAYITESRQDILEVKLLHFKWQILSEVSQTPDPKVTVKVELLLDPVCTYSVSVQPHLKLVFSQLARVYTPAILAYMAVILILTLRTQLHSLHQSGVCSLFHVAMNQGAKPYFILPLVKILSKILSLQMDESPVHLTWIRLGLPEPSLNVMTKLAWEQLVIPLMLYAIAFGLVHILGLVCMFSVVFSGKIVNKIGLNLITQVRGSIAAWTADLSSVAQEILLRVPPLIFCIFITLGSGTCMALPLSIGAIYFFLKLCKMYEEYLEDLLHYSMKVITTKLKDMKNRRKGRKSAEELQAEKEAVEAEENRQCLSDINVHVTVFLLYLAALLPHIPSLLVWAHNYKYNKKLDPDPSFGSAVFIIISCSSCFWMQSFPNRNVPFYAWAADALYPVALATAVYAPTKLAFVPVFIALSMTLVALHQWIGGLMKVIHEISNPSSDAEGITSNANDVPLENDGDDEGCAFDDDSGSNDEGNLCGSNDEGIQYDSNDEIPNKDLQSERSESCSDDNIASITTKSEEEEKDQ